MSPCPVSIGQLDVLEEMAVIARGEAKACGVTFHPIVNYPVSWTI